MQTLDQVEWVTLIFENLGAWPVSWDFDCIGKRGPRSRSSSYSTGRAGASDPLLLQFGTFSFPPVVGHRQLLCDPFGDGGEFFEEAAEGEKVDCIPRCVRPSKPLLEVSAQVYLTHKSLAVNGDGNSLLAGMRSHFLRLRKSRVVSIPRREFVRTIVSINVLVVLTLGSAG